MDDCKRRLFLSTLSKTVQLLVAPGSYLALGLRWHQDILQSVGYYDVELDVCKPSPCWTTPSDPSLLSCGKDIANQQASLKSVHAIAIADCLDQADGATALSSTGGDLSECEMSGAYGDSLAYLSCGALGQFVCSL